MNIAKSNLNLFPFAFTQSLNMYSFLKVIPRLFKYCAIVFSPYDLTHPQDLVSPFFSVAPLTITTLPDHYPVKKGTKVASMRIIPLLTKEENILEAEKLCRKDALMRILPYRLRKVGVIITGSKTLAGKIAEIIIQNYHILDDAIYCLDFYR